MRESRFGLGIDFLCFSCYINYFVPGKTFVSLNFKYLDRMLLNIAQIQLLVGISKPIYRQI